MPVKALYVPLLAIVLWLVTERDADRASTHAIGVVPKAAALNWI